MEARFPHDRGAELQRLAPELAEDTIPRPEPGDAVAPLDRLIAYGRARAAFLIDNYVIARASLDGGDPAPAGARTPLRTCSPPCRRGSARG